MTRKRWFRWTAAIAAGLFALVIAIVASGYAWLHTRGGLEFLAESVGRAASDERTTVHIAGLEGPLLTSPHIAKFTVADPKGIFLQAKNITIDWRPLALLSGTLDIGRLAIARLSLARLPEAAETGGQRSVPGFALPVGLRVGKITVADIALASPVLGKAQRLSAQASGRLAADLSAAGLNLSVSSVEGGANSVEIGLAFAAEPAEFTARVRIDEPEGGIIGRLAGLPEGKRLFVDLNGDGPPDGWHGALTVETGTGISAASRIDVALKDGVLAISLDGTADATAALPAGLRPLLGPHVDFQADATFKPAEGLTVKRLTAESESISISGTGKYVFNPQNIAAKIAVQSTKGHALSKTLPILPFEAARIDSTVSGTPKAPVVTLDYRFERVKSDPLRVASVAGAARLTPSAGSAFSAKGTVRADGIETTAAVPPGLIGRTLDATLAGTIHNNGSIRGLTANATTGDLVLAVSGNLDQKAESAADFSIEHKRLGRLLHGSGITLDCALRVEGTVRAAFREGAVSLTASGALENLSGSRELTALTGENVPFAGAVSWHEGQPLEIIGLKLETAAGRLRGDGTVDVAAARLNGNIEASVVALKRFSPLAGSQLGGSVSLSVAIDGSFDAPTARGQAQIANLDIDGRPVGQIGVGFAARKDHSAALVALRLGGTIRDKGLSGSLDARLDGSAIALSDIDIALGKNRIAGSFGLDQATKRVSGALDAALNDLADLPEIGGPPLAGAAKIRATANGNRVDLTASARDVRIGNTSDSPTTVKALSAQLRLNDPFTTQIVAGEVRLTGLARAGLQGGQATVAFEGAREAIGWRATARLTAPYAASVASRGKVFTLQDSVKISVNTLKGEIAGEAIALRAPTSATVAPNVWRIEPIDLTVAKGRVRLSAAVHSGRIEASGRVDDLPGRLASLADGRLRLSGSVSGTLDMSGALRQPNLTAALRARGIRPASLPQEDFTGFSITLDIAQNVDNIGAQIALFGPDETRATASLKTRPFVRLETLSLSPEPTAPLTGQLEAKGRLELIDSLIGLGENRLAGRAEANATFSGTFDAPRIEGNARLQDGFYEGVATGSVLRNIDAQVSFKGDSAELTHLSADDGAEGRISGRGSVHLSEASGANGGIEISLERFTAIRNALATVVTSGTLSLNGSLQAPKLTGQLTIDRGEIRIPDELPEDVVRLDVVEINRSVLGPQAEPAKEPSASAAYPVALDIGIAVPGKTFVRGRGLTSEWQGKLRVSGNSRKPQITGKLESVRGMFSFAGKSFVLKSGSVIFPDGALGEPEIAATAEAKLSDIVAVVDMSGTVSKPSISVSSVPPMPQEEVLAQILFGKTTGQLSAVQAAQLAQTAATLSGKGGAGIVDKIRQALGVDVLDVEASDGKTTGATLKAGKYVTDDVFLSVTQGTTLGSQKVGVEVQVLPNVTVESNVGGDASSDIGINWKWDY